MSLDAAFLAGLNVAAIVFFVGFVAVRLTAWLGEALDRALAVAIVALSQAVGVPLVLAILGVLGRSSVLVLHVIVAVVVTVTIRTAPSSKVDGRRRSPFSLAAVGLGAGLGVLSAMPSLYGRTSLHSDTRNYHFINLLTWVQERTIWTLPFENLGFFTSTHPGNAELLGAALLLATGGDHLLFLGNIAWGVLAVFACGAISRDLGGAAGVGALVAIAVLASPIAFFSQAHSLASDLPAVAGLLAGCAAILRARRTSDARWVILAGLALGLAVGSKYTVLVLGAIVLAWAFVTLRPQSRALLLLPGLMLLAAPWFARNALLTGNPIFPQAVHIGSFMLLPGGRSPILELSTTVADHLVAGRWEVLGRWARLGAIRYGPAALLAGAGIAAGFVKGREPERNDRLALAAFAAAGLLVYAISPFTGAGPRGLSFLMASNVRYALPAVFIGSTLAAVRLHPLMRSILVASTLAYSAWQMVEGVGFRSDLRVDATGASLALASALAAVGVCLIGRRWALSKRSLVVSGLVVAVLGMSALIWRVERMVQPTTLDRLVAATGSRDIVVVGAGDLLSIVGDRLDTRLRSVSARGEAGEFARHPERLTRALTATPANVLVLHDGSIGVPEGFSPPHDWKLLGSTPGGDVYVRKRSQRN